MLVTTNSNLLGSIINIGDELDATRFLWFDNLCLRVKEKFAPFNKYQQKKELTKTVAAVFDGQNDDIDLIQFIFQVMPEIKEDVIKYQNLIEKYAYLSPIEEMLFLLSQAAWSPYESEKASSLLTTITKMKSKKI